MPRQGNGGRDELRHGSASTTEPTQATLGEVTPTPSRAAVPATPTPDRRGLGREPRARPRGGPLADRVPVTPSARTFGPLRARSLHVWPVSSSPGGGVARPTGVGGVPRPGGYCVGAPAMLAVAATAAAATVPRPCGVITWGGAAREAVRGRRPRPSAAPSSSVAGCGPHVPAGPSASPPLTLLCARQDRDGFAPGPPHTHLSPVPTTARDPHGVGSALSPLNLLGLGCRRLLPATRSRPVLPHLLGRSPDPSHRAC